MAEFQRVDLQGCVDGEPITFLRAEMSKEYQLPFALIRYSLHGEEQEYGIRLDLDKRVFIDHLQDEQCEEFLEKAAPKIAEFLGARMHDEINP